MHTDVATSLRLGNKTNYLRCLHIDWSKDERLWGAAKVLFHASQHPNQPSFMVDTSWHQPFFMHFWDFCVSSGKKKPIWTTKTWHFCKRCSPVSPIFFFRREAAHVCVLLIYLAHSFLLDETCPLRLGAEMLGADMVRFNWYFIDH